MRTAEEIMKEQLSFFTNLMSGEKGGIIKAINQARKEAIEECAEVAKTTSTCTVWNCEGESVDKQSILKLIDQIK